MPVIRGEHNTRSRGGTELLIEELERHVDPDLLSRVRIYPSRTAEAIDPATVNLYWLHDIPGDPGSEHLMNGGWRRFDRLVFVSNWQMQQYISAYGIPWHKCTVVLNAIETMDLPCRKPDDRVRLIYHTTPHRGLAILVPVFIALCEQHDGLELDVFSSLKIYGWDEADRQFEPLYEQCRRHPCIRYHGSVDYRVVRECLGEAHIFAYPNIHKETSCRALMEAMTSGCLAVHPNYGALYETAAGLTWMYPWHESPQSHADIFYMNMMHAIAAVRSHAVASNLALQKTYADSCYSWSMRRQHWNALLASVLRERGVLH